MIQYQKWLDTDMGTRIKIALLFGIQRGVTHISNNRIIDDGYKLPELTKVISLEALQKCLQTNETDYQFLWDALVASIEGKPFQINKNAQENKGEVEAEQSNEGTDSKEDGIGKGSKKTKRDSKK